MHIESKPYSPGLVSLLPLFYIGWSDSVLSPAEMKYLHKKIEALPFLTNDEKEYLKKYSNPANSPDADTFKSWLDAIKLHAQQVSKGQKTNLVQFGIELAEAAVNHKPNEIFNSPKTHQALLEIQSILNVDSEENVASMLHTLGIAGLDVAPSKATFDVQRMTQILDGKYHEEKRKLKKLLRDPYFEIKHITDKATHRQRTLEMLKYLADSGFGATGYPKAYSGNGDMGQYMSIFETLAFHDNSLTIKFGVQFGLFGGAIANLGTEHHHRLYLEPTGKANLLGCFAMTETGHGSNVKDLETTATYDATNDTIIIHSPSYTAGKEYIGNALHGSLAVVFAQLIVAGEHHGIHAILVPYRDEKGQLLPGIRVEDCGYKMGLNGVDNGRIWFDQVSVPRENLLNRFGDINDHGAYESKIHNPNKRFFSMLGALVGGRICVGLAGINAAKTALHIAIKYALKRRQFPGIKEDEEWLIIDYPSHQKRLVPKLIKNYAYYIALTNLMEQFVSADESDMRKIETKAAGLKSMATWLCRDTIQECREACGGKGYLSENRLDRLKADTDIFTTFEGDNTVLLQLVAKGLLTEFKESFHDDGSLSVIKFLYNKVSLSMSEINPFESRNTSTEHLESDEFHSAALRYREKKLLMTLSDRMRKFMSKRLSTFDTFLKCQAHMIELAQAYIERLAYREMDKKILSLDPSPEREMLHKIKRMYALLLIEEHKDFYLENDYMDGTKTKAIRRVINKQYQQLRPDLESLVDVWQIPSESVGAQIVTDIRIDGV